MPDRVSCALLLALGGLALAGCATGPSGRAATSQAGETFAVRFRADAPSARGVLPVPVQEVWATLPQAFADLGYPGGPSARADEQVYLTKPLTIQGQLYTGELNSDYLDCGHTTAGTLAADTYEITFAILARVSPHTPDTTLVEVLVDGTARARGLSTNRVFCSGTGRLEAELLQRIAKRTNATVRSVPWERRP